MILAIKYAREQKIPFLGICLGFQLAVIEWARSVLEVPGMTYYMPPHIPLSLKIWHRSGATSAEFDPNTEHPIIVFMPEISRTHMGGTMRLGLRPTIFDSDSEKWSKVRKLYGGVDKIWERHRHRYEVNPQLVDRLQQSGCSFIGRDEKGERMQVLELKGRFLVYHLNLISHSIIQITHTSSDSKLTPNFVPAH